MANNSGKDGDVGTIVKKKTETKTKTQLQRPKLYKVLLHNDDFTTMEFVVDVLQTIFGHSETAATAIMLNIHRTGIGIAGIYPFSIAEQKVSEVMRAAEEAEFPLLCTMEPDEPNSDDGEGNE